MESLGHSVKAASGGRAALELYRAESAAIDCVPLDVMMPEMDGWEPLEQLHAIDPTAVVLLSSGYADRGTRRCAVLEQALRLREPMPPV